jgi:hypothetical protein
LAILKLEDCAVGTGKSVLGNGFAEFGDCRRRGGILRTEGELGEVNVDAVVEKLAADIEPQFKDCGSVGLVG